MVLPDDSLLCASVHHTPGHSELGDRPPHLSAPPAHLGGDIPHLTHQKKVLGELTNEKRVLRVLWTN